MGEKIEDKIVSKVLFFSETSILKDFLETCQTQNKYVCTLFFKNTNFDCWMPYLFFGPKWKWKCLMVVRYHALFLAQNGNGNCKIVNWGLDAIPFFLSRKKMETPFCSMMPHSVFGLKMEMENINFDGWMSYLFFAQNGNGNRKR